MTHSCIVTLNYIQINLFEYNTMLLYTNESYILFIRYQYKVKELFILFNFACCKLQLMIKITPCEGTLKVYLHKVFLSSVDP